MGLAALALAPCASGRATPAAASLNQAEFGTIRGVVYDKDFETPLAGAVATVVELRRTALTTEQGNYVLSQIPPGRYTLVFSRDGYARVVRADVSVSAGQLTDLDAWLEGEFTEMDELVVQDVLTGSTAAEAALLVMRFESPALVDSISAELMNRAGASDAAGALRLVTGASLQDGKTAVIRGLPDRYVSSQLNGVRLPSADEDKRAVELDQFPAAAIQSLQVTKTFTPDQQGDASGGAVDVRLRGVPEEGLFQFKLQGSGNSQVFGRDDFLSYEGGGLDFWGRDDGGRDIQFDNLGQSWDGAVGVSEEDAPIDWKGSFAIGDRWEVSDGVKIGALVNLFYERDSSFYDDGQSNSLWVDQPGQGLVPETSQGTPEELDFKTALFDVTRATQSVQWGGLGVFGIETEKHRVGLTWLYTHTAEDSATLAIDTRGKEFFFPGYDPDDPTHPGNAIENRRAAPYIRTETLEYTERDTGSLQLHGEHELPFGAFRLGAFAFQPIELDWTLADSFADSYQPDKRQFGAYWLPPSSDPAVPLNFPAVWLPYKPAATFLLGNLQRIWTTIEEDSQLYSLNLKLPFEQWSEERGYLKFGLFGDDVERAFDQDTFSNFEDAGAGMLGDFDDPWSQHFPDEKHAITASEFDVDYEGDQKITAWYSMLDLPVGGGVTFVGGARLESTSISIMNDPESSALWFPPGATAPVDLEGSEADVDFDQDDVLPSAALEYEPVESLTLRASYSQTIARQTFKELTPIQQQEFVGAPVFVGNPDLGMSDVENFDLRLDYEPYESGLFSVSWFHKNIDDPIEYVQRLASLTFTTPVNYPEGELDGFEFEMRQDLGAWWGALGGLYFGANATLISSEVQLTDQEISDFEKIDVPITSRDMLNAPEHLYNVYLTYDIEKTGTRFGLFYTVQGDTLVAGAGQSNGNFVPDVYAQEYGTLNFSLAQRLGKYFVLEFQAKNLTNPTIEEVYRSDFSGPDATRSSYTSGIEYSLAIGAKFGF